MIGNYFDGLTLICLFACVVVWPTQWISDGQNRWLRIVTVGLVVSQVVLVGPRMQLIPAYLVALMFFALLLVKRGAEPSSISESKEGFAKKLARWGLVFGSAALILLSAAGIYS